MKETKQIYNMPISNRQVALNHTMYQTGLKAKLVQMTCPSDVFIEFYVQKLNIFALNSITYLLSHKFKNSPSVCVQYYDGSLGIKLNDKIIDEVFGKDRN